MKMKFSSSFADAISIVSITDASKVRRLHIGEDIKPVGPGPDPYPEGDKIPHLADYIDGRQNLDASMRFNLPPVVVVSEQKNHSKEVFAAQMNKGEGKQKTT